MKPVGESENKIRQTLPRDLGDYRLLRMESGVSTEVYKMTDGEKVLYLRLSELGKSFEAEVEAMRLCRETSILVPSIVYVENDNSELGRSMMITTEVSGKCVQREDEEVRNIIRTAGRNLALMNMIGTGGIGYIEDHLIDGKLASRGSNYSEFILNGIDQRINELTIKKMFSSEQENALLKILVSNKAMFDEYRQGGLSHGDFCLDHIFQNEGRFSGFIDFGDIRSASPYHDLAHYLVYSKVCYDQLVEGYKEIRRLDDESDARVRVEALCIAINKLWWKTTRGVDVTNSGDLRYIQNYLRQF